MVETARALGRWAQRIHDLGIGAAHAAGTPSTASLTAALTRALDPVATSRAQSIAAAVRTDGATVAAERLVATHA